MAMNDPPTRKAKPTMDGLTEPAAVTCECTHDLSQHTQGYWAPCNVDGCECKDFTINEEGE